MSKTKRTSCSRRHGQRKGLEKDGAGLPLDADAFRAYLASLPGGPDLLKVRTYDLAPIDESRLREALINFISDGLQELDLCRLQQVARCVELTRKERGCFTPFEEFHHELVDEHFDGWAVTPERVEQYLDPNNEDGFRCHFDEMCEALRRFAAFYPEPVKATPADKEAR